MSIFLKQAKMLLDEIDIDALAVKEAKAQMNSLSKVSGVMDLVHDPKFQNIITLLTPFVVNYKVNQVIRLLQELAKENQNAKIDPNTGLRRFI